MKGKTLLLFYVQKREAYMLKMWKYAQRSWQYICPVNTNCITSFAPLQKSQNA